MLGILACGAAIPVRRLPLSLLSGRSAKPDSPERALAWSDEDAITLAVAAARDCLLDRDRSTIDLLSVSYTHLTLPTNREV